MFIPKKNTFTVETANESFEPNAAKTAMNFAKTALKLREYQQKIIENPSEGTVGEILNDFCGELDILLESDGACGRIFAGKTVDFYDLCDLYFHIKGELSAFGTKKRKEWGGKNELISEFVDR